jgi:hypothetical protein
LKFNRKKRREIDFYSICLFASCQFYLVAIHSEAGVTPSLAQSTSRPAVDDEVLPPVKEFALAEEPALPKSVDAPVELAPPCANALCTS